MKKTMIRFGTALLGAALFAPSAFAADGMVQESHENHDVSVVIQEIGDSFQDTKIMDMEVTVHENTEATDENIEPAWIFSHDYEVTGNDVNVRSGPGTSYKSVGKLQSGQIISVKSIDNGWAKFKYDGVYRYVSANYIQEA